MLDKISFWVVLIWMFALLAMGFWAVREVWKEDVREATNPDATPPPPTTGETPVPTKNPDTSP